MLNQLANATTKIFPQDFANLIQRKFFPANATD
jgi:hypothetical protein